MALDDRDAIADQIGAGDWEPVGPGLADEFMLQVACGQTDLPPPDQIVKGVDAVRSDAAKRLADKG